MSEKMVDHGSVNEIITNESRTSKNIPDIDSSEKEVNLEVTWICEQGLSDCFQKWEEIEQQLELFSIKSGPLLYKEVGYVAYSFTYRVKGSKADKFKKEVYAAIENIPQFKLVDVNVLMENVIRKHTRLVVFDLDSTLIQQEVIDEIARYAGVVDKVAAITEQAMRGELDFKESLKKRVALLKGTSLDVFEKIKENLIFTPGAEDLCSILKKLGCKLAVISGGFMPIAAHVKEHLNLDYAFANTLAVNEQHQKFTGETIGEVVDAELKAELLQWIAKKEGINIKQVVAVGDGANDLLMMAASGLGIAFNAKPKVQQQAEARINQKSLLNILFLLGFCEKELIAIQLL